jgi:hypothetical protein
MVTAHLIILGAMSVVMESGIQKKHVMALTLVVQHAIH